VVVRNVSVDKKIAQERRLLIELLAERLETTPEWVRSRGLPLLVRQTRGKTMSLEIADHCLRGLPRPNADNTAQRDEAEATEVERRDTRWDKDRTAFQRLQPELQREYPGKFIAFEDGEVIAIGDTRWEAADEAHRITGVAKSRVVRHVDEDIPPIRNVGVRLDRPRSMERTK